MEARKIDKMPDPDKVEYRYSKDEYYIETAISQSDGFRLELLHLRTWAVFEFCKPLRASQIDDYSEIFRNTPEIDEKLDPKTNKITIAAKWRYHDLIELEEKDQSPQDREFSHLKQKYFEFKIEQLERELSEKDNIIQQYKQNEAEQYKGVPH